jgi:uncharacterized protein YvpB
MWKYGVLIILPFAILLGGCQAAGDSPAGQVVSPTTTLPAIETSTPAVIKTDTSAAEDDHNHSQKVTSPQVAETPEDNPAVIPIPTETAGNSPTTLSSTPVAPVDLPDEWFISGVESYRQSYAISCESRSAVDWASFFDVSIYESTFQFGLARSDNPNKGYVGNVHDPWGQIPPYSYGVHAAPVADLLKEEYGLPARAVTGFTLEELKQEIASNQPVVVWVIGNMVAGTAVEYVDHEGDTALVAPYEHTVIVTGYDGQNIRYLNNSRFFQVPEEVFLRSWEVLGNMAVIYDDSLQGEY